MVSDELVIILDTEYVTVQADCQQEQGDSRILLEVHPNGAVPWFHRRSCHEIMGSLDAGYGDALSCFSCLGCRGETPTLAF